MSKLEALNEAKAIQAEVAQCLQVVNDIGRKVDLSTIAKHLDNVTKKLTPVLNALEGEASRETRAKLSEDTDESSPPKDAPKAQPRKKR